MMILTSTGFFREDSYLSRTDIWRLGNENFIIVFKSGLLVSVWVTQLSHSQIE